MPDDAVAPSRRSPLFRLAFLALFVVLLQVPILAIAMLVRERQLRRDAAVAEVSAKWGRAQDLAGPVLVVPYRVRAVAATPDGVPARPERIEYATFLPERLRVEGRLVPEQRRRGLFAVPVYALDLAWEGVFDPPDAAALGLAGADLLLDQAVVAVGISDVRAIQERTSLRWGERDIEFLPGPARMQGATGGLHAPVALAPGGGAVHFAFPLRLHGTGSASFTPSGRQTDVKLASPWPSPSFQASGCRRGARCRATASSPSGRSRTWGGTFPSSGPPSTGRGRRSSRRASGSTSWRDSTPTAWSIAA